MQVIVSTTKVLPAAQQAHRIIYNGATEKSDMIVTKTFISKKAWNSST